MTRSCYPVVTLIFLVLPAFAQSQAQGAKPHEASRSTLEIDPGKPTLKTPEIQRNKPLSPFKRLPKYILHDQKHIWTSPFHTSKSDAKWWVIFGTTTAALVATDRWTSRQLPNTKDQVTIATWTSRLGAAYTLIPIMGAFYFAGTAANNERFRETTLLGLETLGDTVLVESVLKMATDRERPLEGRGNGAWWQSSGSIYNASFPSGHAINTWGVASIIAHEYPRPLIVPITAYGLAAVVTGSRFAARRHFASDTIVGAAMGWFIGDWVFARRHNRSLDQGTPRSKKAVIERLLAHVRFGM